MKIGTLVILALGTAAPALAQEQGFDPPAFAPDLAGLATPGELSQPGEAAFGKAQPIAAETAEAEDRVVRLAPQTVALGEGSAAPAWTTLAAAASGTATARRPLVVPTWGRFPPPMFPHFEDKGPLAER